MPDTTPELATTGDAKLVSERTERPKQELAQILKGAIAAVAGTQREHLSKNVAEAQAQRAWTLP